MTTATATPPDVDAAASPRRRRWPWVLAIGLSLALLGGAVYAVFATPLLGVRAVTVTGAPDEIAARVRAAVDIPEGTPLARVDLDGVAAAARSVPEVAFVDVARVWPDTVSIAVTARVPVAVTSANGSLRLLDATGDPYREVSAAPPGLVSVMLVTPGVGDPSTVAALAVVQALTPGFRPEVVAVSARAPWDVEVALADGRTVLWGSAERSEAKMQILPAVLEQPGTVYDVSDPALVSVR